MTAEERIAKLETALAFQEQSLEDMSRELYAHQKQMDKQQLLIDRLTKKIKDLEEWAQDEKPGNEKPPHW